MLSALWPGALVAQKDYPHLRDGDKMFEEGRYTDAETAYRKALAEEAKSGTAYNLGNSMFLQNRIPEALAEYQKTVMTAEDPGVKARAYYNMGNAYFQNNEFGQSINAYKESLKINPNDPDAKKNLMLAMRQLKQQQEQQNPEQQQQEQQQNEQQQDEQNSREQEQQQQQQQTQSREEQASEEINKEEANEILKAIEREDQRVQEKLKKSGGKSTPPVKDW
jgi:tetratricopeptide (TPR) repeat protein